MLELRNTLSSTPTPTPEEILAALIPILSASNTSRYAGTAAFVIFSYDHVLTLSDEIRFFWSGEWTLSRILFFTNRYIPHLGLIWGLVCFFGQGLSPEFCTRSVRGIWIVTVTAMLIAQAVLVLRIWYLFRHSAVARALVLFFFFACGIGSATSLYFVGRQVDAVSLKSLGLGGLSLEISGCLVAPPSDVWRVFTPALVLHTILYLFTAYRGLRRRSIVAEAAPVAVRLVRDGGILYIVVLASVGFAAIGSALTSQPSIQLICVYSNLMLALTSASISRIMLSIRSLAAELTSDPSALMLSNNELSRVPWRKGPNAGDIIVDMDTDGYGRLEGAPMAMEIRYARDVQETTSERDIHDKCRGRARQTSS